MTRRTVLCTVLAGLAAACRTGDPLGSPALVQPGAPGRPSRVIGVEAATDVSQVGVDEADVRFVRGMIAHHAQALEMTALLATRTAHDDMRLLATRIDRSQTDEIVMMEQWLDVRGQACPSGHGHEAGGTPMPGMLTAVEMEHLAAAGGDAFDRLFLKLMIKHHEGAVTMVEQLFASPRAAQDSDIFAFASDVEADQRMEIRRMQMMLAERVGTVAP